MTSQQQIGDAEQKQARSRKRPDHKANAYSSRPRCDCDERPRDHGSPRRDPQGICQAPCCLVRRATESRSCVTFDHSSDEEGAGLYGSEIPFTISRPLALTFTAVRAPDAVCDGRFTELNPATESYSLTSE